jgi:ubiquinone/menaquinone biosynthesis C-methylase UbiE
MTNPLFVACDHYYYKPMAALFNAYHLRAYIHAQPEMRSPILDVGCSSGGFGIVFERQFRPIPKMTGVDLESKAIEQARQVASHCYDELLAADATNLPFANESFNTIVSHASMVSFGNGVEQAAAEMHRVLRPGGRVFATLATELFEQHYPFPQLFRRLGLKGLAKSATASMNRRLPHCYAFSAQDWIEVFENKGFEVGRVFGFFPASLVRQWGLLAWTPMRIHSALKLVPSSSLRSLVRNFYMNRFKARFERTPVETELDEAAYILIQARRCRD